MKFHGTENQGAVKDDPPRNTPAPPLPSGGLFEENATVQMGQTERDTTRQANKAKTGRRDQGKGGADRESETLRESLKAKELESTSETQSYHIAKSCAMEKYDALVEVKRQKATQLEGLRRQKESEQQRKTEEVALRREKERQMERKAEEEEAQMWKKEVDVSRVGG